MGVTMMLKKNDKIILIVGVVILILAGIGIAMYTVPDNGEDEVGEASQKEKTYTYTWEQETADKTIGSTLYADKNEPYEESHMISTRDGTVLTNVEFILSWTDDSTYGLLVTRGQDTLTAEITNNGNTKMESSQGEGNLTFTFNVHSRPSSDSVLAEDKSEAEQIINNMLSDKNSAEFDVMVSVQTGESIFRLLKYLRDQGNDFELTASYTYYEYTLQEPENDTNDDDDMKDTGDDSFDHNIGEFYINLGYGRGMI